MVIWLALGVLILSVMVYNHATSATIRSFLALPVAVLICLVVFLAGMAVEDAIWRTLCPETEMSKDGWSCANQKANDVSDLLAGLTLSFMPPLLVLIAALLAPKAKPWIAWIAFTLPFWALAWSAWKHGLHTVALPIYGWLWTLASFAAALSIQFPPRPKAEPGQDG